LAELSNSGFAQKQFISSLLKSLNKVVSPLPAFTGYEPKRFSALIQQAIKLATQQARNFNFY
jgi:hypothetical protein